MNLIEMAMLAKKASRSVRQLSGSVRSQVLRDFAWGLIENADHIIEENALDLKEAEENGMSTAMLDRLRLDRGRMEGIAEGILQVERLDDPLHRVMEERVISSGVHLKKVTVPIGVIGIIFESRPNVTADCAALCFKSGNTCVLKGGKESYRSSLAIVNVMKEALKKNGVSEDAVMLAEKPSHEETQKFMECTEYVDLLIPRGGRNLIRAVVEHAKVPVIETGAGICHTFVDESADLRMAERIIINAKCSRPSVCNAMETLLVHEKIADTFVPHIVNVMKEHGVTIYGNEKACAIVPSLEKGNETNWATEYDDLIMNLVVVSSVEEACDHIETYGTHHSDCIVTEDEDSKNIFFASIDSACLYHNASTRFTDGFEFGLGAEIGISTQKLHARGPMGLHELTSYAYYLEGEGEIR
jgi:glutamate-5-semialdehyde dehydrogenase